MKKIFILISLLALILISGYLFYREGTLPVNKKSKSTVIFVIEKGENLNSIINNLSKADLIRSRLIFYLIIKQLGIERDIQAGDFRLSKAMNAFELADELQHGTIDVWITIPEGLRKEEIASILSEKFDLSQKDFIAQAEEGYLFPDTYLIPKDPNPKQIIDIMTSTFWKKYSGNIQNKANKKILTDKKIVILASIVEREAKYDQDRAQVASILLRRYLTDYPLQVDATIQYALGYQAKEYRWWKKSLTFDDLKYVSPYNTYLNTGLPPTAICNPGLASIKAVIDADKNTPYLFYLSDPKGTTHYAKTYEDHLINIEKYLRN